MDHAIVIRGLTKSFGDNVAVRDLDLVVPRGSLCGFIGPNGAGKTTTLRMIMAILFPDRGELSVLGRRSAFESKDRIGYLPEERGVYRKMKVGAFLTYIARVKGVRGDVAARVRQWLERVGLGDVVHKRCEELSKGMQQKVQFLTTVIHDPELLILDEPFSGLDPVNMRLLRDLIDEQHRAGKTIIFSTHVMHQAEQLCDHIFMIHRGEKVLDASIQQIRERYATSNVLVEPVEPSGAAERIAALPGVQATVWREGLLEVSLGGTSRVQETIRAIVEAVPVLRIELHRPTLEDVFVEIAQGAGSDDDALRAALRESAAARSAGGVA